MTLKYIRLNTALITAACLLSILFSRSQTSAPLYTIPVVFHILHQGGVENISDTQVLDAISILNKDFQKQNADTINIVPSFTNNIANVQFKFQLATIDPNGNCTNGIIRHYTHRTDWLTNDFSYFAYTWPRNKYLNIYIVRSMNIPGGNAYTFFPGSGVQAAADVIIALHNVCGSIGTSNATNSRWITQKVGHWFNLQHTWGLNNTLPTVCGDDGVSDTPLTKGFATCNLANANVCNPAIIENVQNFMDASPCKSMFTNGQKARMHTCITGTINNRNNLSSPGNLIATGINSIATNCIPQLQVAVLPSATVCVGKPITINSYTYNANPGTYSWSATNGVSISNATLANPAFTFNGGGNFTVTCVVANSNGSSSASLIITAVNSSALIFNAYQESFETPALPANWILLNSTTPSTFWNVTNVASSHLNQSIFIAAENAPGGSVEILQTPSYDFLNNQGSNFTFSYAYALFSTTHKDVFKVQASKDCGGSWKDIYVPGVTTLASGSGGITSSLFIPTPEQWKTYNVASHPNFTGFLNEPNVIFRFYFREDSAGFGNRIYLDQINFDSPVGINEFTKSIALSLHPNPSSGEINVGFTLSDYRKVKINIITASGSTVGEQSEILLDAGKHKIILNSQKKLAPGIYFVEIEFNDLKAVKKFIIE